MTQATDKDEDIFRPSTKESTRVPGAISSNPLELASSLSYPPPESTRSGPPTAVIQNAMERGRPMVPLSTIVAVGAGIFIVLVGLVLLLFL